MQIREGSHCLYSPYFFGVANIAFQVS